MKKYQVLLLVLSIASLGIILSGCFVAISPQQPTYQPSWHSVGGGTTNELKCSNMWHSSSYFVLPITVNSNEATQITIWANVEAIESPPSDFYVYLMSSENYNAWLNGASVNVIELADLTSEPNLTFETSSLPVDTYYLIIFNDYQAILFDYPGEASYTVSAFY